MVKGVYCLLINLKYDSVIKIGKNNVSFPKGYYCYVGSALNNLQKRIERHKSKNKKNHWHIDYFLEKAKILDVKTMETEEKLECWLSDKIKDLKSKVIMDKFGSTDCRCKTHLHYFEKDPSKDLDKIFK